MTKPNLFGEKALRQIARTVRENTRRTLNPHRSRGRWNGGGENRRQVILKEDLFAAVSTKTDPSTADAYVLTRRRNGNLVNTGRTITIVNRFENISVDAGTYAKAEWIDGEWQLYAADCGAESVSVSVRGGTSGGGGLGSETEPP
jgi:hypothetical protein